LADLARHLGYLEEAVADARTAMLSRRKAMLAAYLVDAYADRLFRARAEPAADVLEFRAALAGAHPALASLFDLVGGRAELVTEAVEVPLAEYSKLGVEDFMVSLYNGHTVQRLRIIGPDGSRQDVHEVLAAALEAYLGEGGTTPSELR
jgi:hypothetical protein